MGDGKFENLPFRSEDPQPVLQHPLLVTPAAPEVEIYSLRAALGQVKVMAEADLKMQGAIAANLLPDVKVALKETHKPNDVVHKVYEHGTLDLTFDGSGSLQEANLKVDNGNAEDAVFKNGQIISDHSTGESDATFRYDQGRVFSADLKYAGGVAHDYFEFAADGSVTLARNTNGTGNHEIINQPGQHTYTISNPEGDVRVLNYDDRLSFRAGTVRSATDHNTFGIVPEGNGKGHLVPLSET